MTYMVGAYASSPSFEQWKPEQEKAFYDGLSELSWVAGLEHPFYGQLHRFDSAWFLRNIPSRWNYVLTCIPGIMNRMEVNPRFGLASDSQEDRNHAIQFVSQAHRAVCELNMHLKRSAVISVALHSSPRRGIEGVSSSREAFAESLAEIGSWNWQGAHLCVEHCDAYKQGQTPAKGFLSLEDEIWAVQQNLVTPVGVMINWGRSAIEGRSAVRAEQHLNQARLHGVLQGLIFSGVTALDAEYGEWADSHAPFATERAKSLLTVDAATRCLQVAGGASALRFLGFKIQALPQSMTVEQRLKLITQSGFALQQAQSQIHHSTGK